MIDIDCVGAYRTKARNKKRTKSESTFCSLGRSAFVEDMFCSFGVDEHKGVGARDLFFGCRRVFCEKVNVIALPLDAIQLARARVSE